MRGLLRLLRVRSAPSAMMRAGGWWREPLIMIKDELDRDHHLLHKRQPARKSRNTTREPQRAKRARRLSSPLPHLTVHRTGSAGHAAPRNRAESAACASSGHLTACSDSTISKTQSLSPSRQSSASRAATNYVFLAIRTVLVLLISPPSPSAVRSQPFFAELAAAGRAPSARRWTSHVAPLSAAWLDLLSCLRRWVRYSKQYACASSGEAHRAQPPTRTPSPPPAARQHQRSCNLVRWPSRGRVAIDSRSMTMSHQGTL